MNKFQEKLLLIVSIIVFITVTIVSLFYLNSRPVVQNDSHNPNIVEVANSEKKFSQKVLSYLFNHTSFDPNVLKKNIKEDKTTRKELKDLLSDNVYLSTQGYYNLKASYIMPNSPIDFNEEYLSQAHADLALPLWVGSNLVESQIDKMENLSSITVDGKTYPAVRVKTIVGVKNYYLQLGSQEGWDGKVYGGSEKVDFKVDLVLLKNKNSETGFSLYDVEVGDEYKGMLVYSPYNVEPKTKTRTFEFYVNPELEK